MGKIRELPRKRNACNGEGVGLDREKKDNSEGKDKSDGRRKEGDKIFEKGKL